MVLVDLARSVTDRFLAEDPQAAQSKGLCRELFFPALPGLSRPRPHFPPSVRSSLVPVNPPPGTTRFVYGRMPNAFGEKWKLAIVLAKVVAISGSSELQSTITVSFSSGNFCRLAENPEVEPL